MKQTIISVAALFALALPVSALEEPAPAPSPNEIVSAAPQSDWVQIAAEDMLVMTLAPDRDGKTRKVVIQLMPAPFSQGWVENIRTLARAQWYDGISVNRVQDNYVVQWGDPNHDNPEAEGKAKPLPEGLRVMGEGDYVSQLDPGVMPFVWSQFGKMETENFGEPLLLRSGRKPLETSGRFWDPYSFVVGFGSGFPIAVQFNPAFNEEGDANERLGSTWPVHCYGMVGVGRSYSPDTGSGAELYTVIGHAPRHLDRNIALAGRIISGMEHLSSLPRGSGALGFYTAEEADKRTPILRVRVASDLPEAEQPRFEYLSTETESFARYAEARANRRDPFFIVPAGGADICNIPVPIRAVEIEG
ncbi:MAG: peptidylprolyl isomerase [Pseudomonadota bacterium]